MRIDQLKSVYGGRIDAGATGQAGLDGMRLMTELMAEWNPLFAESADIFAVLGKPTRQTPDSMEYVFDGGRASATYSFKLSGGTVIGIEYIPGE